MSNEQLIALLKKNPVSVACALISLLIGVALYFRSDLVPDTAKLLEQKIAEGERLNANVKNSAQLPEQLAAITEARAEIEKRLVRGSELAKNLQYFYRLEAETGAKLLVMRQNPVAAPKPGAKPALIGISYTVSFQGPYFTVMEFLRRLESGTHFCRVSQAGISIIGNNRGGPLTVSLSLELLGQP